MNSSWGGARYLTMARRLLESGRLPGLLRAVADKGERNARFARVRDDLNLLLGLCAAWWRGEYRAVGRQALLSVVAALLYFVMTFFSSRLIALMERRMNHGRHS